MGWSIDLVDPKTNMPADVEPFFYGSNVLIGYLRAGHEAGSGLALWKGEYWTRAGNPRVAKANALREKWGQDCFMDADGTPILVTGQTRAHLTLTFNYRDYFDADRLDGLPGAQTIPLLESTAQALGTDRALDYWTSTPGNAGFACALMLSWARAHPNGVWKVEA